MTNEVRLKLKEQLYNITSNLAYQDYSRTNYHPNNKRKSKKHIPYSLSDETERALEMYKIICKRAEEITKEEEEKLKAFLLTYKLLQPDYLKKAGGKF